MRFWIWLALGLGLSSAPASAADPSALWKIVHGECVPHEDAAGDPAPCAAVDPGYGVLKDIRGIAQYLLIPTERISGIEDPKILAPGAVNYWDPAWRARSFTEARLGGPQPRDAIILAINSAYGRTQDQLHIHVDCVQPAVRAALATNLGAVGGAWARFPVTLAGHSYRAIRINGEVLGGVDPFRVLAESDPAGGMGRHTLVLVGEDFPDGGKGFVLLDDQVDEAAGDFASGEQLQDHSCAVAGK